MVQCCTGSEQATRTKTLADPSVGLADDQPWPHRPLHSPTPAKRRQGLGTQTVCGKTVHYWGMQCMTANDAIGSLVLPLGQHIPQALGLTCITVLDARPTPAVGYAFLQDDPSSARGNPHGVARLTSSCDTTLDCHPHHHQNHRHTILAHPFSSEHPTLSRAAGDGDTTPHDSPPPHSTHTQADI